MACICRTGSRYEKKRPDFVCGTLGSELILVELKRPKDELTKDDLNQLEEYLAISEKYSAKIRSYRAYLMGSSISDEVKTYLRYRRGFTGSRIFRSAVVHASASERGLQ